MRIVDLRNDSRIMRASRTRNVSQVNRIARHHSATAVGDVFAFQNHWRNILRWITGGYHYIILRDGTVQWVYDDHVISNGVGNHNTNTIHICLVGNGNFTVAQEQSFDAIVRTIRARRPNITVGNVLGHREFSGHASNACPGTNMNTIRTRLNSQVATPPPANTGNQFTHVVQRGETLEAIARRHGVTVAQLVEWNGIRNPNMIQIGQRLVVRLGAPAPVAPQPQAPATPPAVSGLSVQYSAHVQNRGWMKWRRNGETAGTTGQSLRMEALRFALANAPAGSGIRCRAHVQNVGWQNWVNAGTIAGTTGQSRQMEAVRFELTGPLATTHHIEYRVHMRDLGWSQWVRNGAVAGTTGQSRRIEAIEIRLVRR